ncbi:BREX system Lon protease-like protein BrxL [Psychrobacter raelei]|uniref:BREX system Lon protease-like protein BrxL n=1 Tax=Psychrobacter raelei TaxID=2565531 RepID=A0AAT9PBR3_9GAMM
MSQLDNKINESFAGLVVRKDLVKKVKGNAIVPTYVLEYLLGQYCATDDDVTIETGIETVKEILRKHYVHRNEAGLVRSNIKEKGRYKVIDKVSVSLNDKNDVYEAQFSNLGINKVLVDSNTIKQHPKLLVSGVWCIADVEYEFTEDRNVSPWILESLKPIQLSRFEFDSYLSAREQFNTEEWIDLLIQSIGFDPELFGKRNKLQQLIRLIPFCERNYNLIELGPKGTGKSHIYSEFSPHGILISGGEVTVPKLFVNNSSGKIGLVGYWDCVAFDEFAGKEKRVDKSLVDIMKNYMANKSFSRGVETLGAEASMVFVGNTQRTVPYMLKHSDLFSELPPSFYDSAFLDRIHFYIPGWEVDIIRSEMFSLGYGFVVDYLAEILRSLRSHDYSDRYQQYFTLSPSISTRDRDGINKTFSGLMKLIYPNGEASKEEIETLLQFAMEGRKRVKDQIMRIDSTYSEVEFIYENESGETIQVRTLEEEEYPRYYHRSISEGESEQDSIVEQKMQQSNSSSANAYQEKPLLPGHEIFKEGRRGISYDNLFGPYLKGASNIRVIDPYIRKFHQIKNFVELLETIIKVKRLDEEVNVQLITVEDNIPEVAENQKKELDQLEGQASKVGINLTVDYLEEGKIHARSISIDTGWKISLDRGLDIFQSYGGHLSFADRLQEMRACKGFDITYIQTDFKNSSELIE